MYEVADYKGNSIWLADDTTLIANSKENLERNLRILKEAAQKYGLEINTKKTKIIRIRGEETHKEIAGCEIVKQIKYLGITIGGKGRDIFKFERENWMIKAKKALGRLIKEIGKCYDKVIVGKALWKQVLMATLMFGKAVVIHLEVEIGKIQSMEYKVYKYLIGVGGFVTVASLCSEIGSSKVITRIMETVILLAKDILEGEFPKVKQHLETEIKRGKGSWIKRANSYIQTLELSWRKIKEMTRAEIK